MGARFQCANKSRNRKAPFPGGEVNAKLPHERARVTGTLVQAQLELHTSAFSRGLQGLFARIFALYS